MAISKKIIGEIESILERNTTGEITAVDDDPDEMEMDGAYVSGCEILGAMNPPKKNPTNPRMNYKFSTTPGGVKYVTPVTAKTTTNAQSVLNAKDVAHRAARVGAQALKSLKMKKTSIHGIGATGKPPKKSSKLLNAKAFKAAATGLVKKDSPKLITKANAHDKAIKTLSAKISAGATGQTSNPQKISSRPDKSVIAGDVVTDDELFGDVDADDELLGWEHTKEYQYPNDDDVIGDNYDQYWTEIVGEYWSEIVGYGDDDEDVVGDDPTAGIDWGDGSSGTPASTSAPTDGSTTPTDGSTTPADGSTPSVDDGSDPGSADMSTIDVPGGPPNYGLPDGPKGIADVPAQEGVDYISDPYKDKGFADQTVYGSAGGGTPLPLGFVLYDMTNHPPPISGLGSYTRFFGGASGRGPGGPDTANIGPSGFEWGNQTDDTGHNDGWYRYRHGEYRPYDPTGVSSSAKELMQASQIYGWGPFIGNPTGKGPWTKPQGGNAKTDHDHVTEKPLGQKEGGIDSSWVKGLRYDVDADQWFWYYDQAPDWATSPIDMVRLKKAQLDYTTKLTNAKADFIQKQTLDRIAKTQADQLAAQHALEDAATKRKIDTENQAAQHQLDLQNMQAQGAQALAAPEAAKAQSALDMANVQLQQQQLQLKQMQLQYGLPYDDSSDQGGGEDGGEGSDQGQVDWGDGTTSAAPANPDEGVDWGD